MANLSDSQIEDLLGAAMAADGGCPHCVVPIIEACQRVFPEIDWVNRAALYALAHPNPGFYWLEDGSWLEKHRG